MKELGGGCAVFLLFLGIAVALAFPRILDIIEAMVAR